MCVLVKKKVAVYKTDHVESHGNTSHWSLVEWGSTMPISEESTSSLSNQWPVSNTWYCTMTCLTQDIEHPVFNNQLIAPWGVIYLAACSKIDDPPWCQDDAFPVFTTHEYHELMFTHLILIDILRRVAFPMGAYLNWHIEESGISYGCLWCPNNEDDSAPGTKKQNNVNSLYILMSCVCVPIPGCGEPFPWWEVFIAPWAGNCWKQPWRRH